MGQKDRAPSVAMSNGDVSGTDPIRAASGTIKVFGPEAELTVTLAVVAGVAGVRVVEVIDAPVGATTTEESDASVLEAEVPVGTEDGEVSVLAAGVGAPAPPPPQAARKAVASAKAGIV